MTGRKQGKPLGTAQHKVTSVVLTTIVPYKIHQTRKGKGHETAPKQIILTTHSFTQILQLGT